MSKLNLVVGCVLMSILFISCKKDKSGDVKLFDATYLSSVQRDSKEGKRLELTYSETPMIDKIADFVTKDGKTATIALYGKPMLAQLADLKTSPVATQSIIPGESQTVINCPIVASADGYTFSGNGTTGNNVTYSYSGSVTDNILSVNLKDVKLPANNFTGKYSLVEFTGDVSGDVPLPIYFNWESSSKFNLPVLSEMEPNSLLAMFIYMAPIMNDNNVCQLLCNVLKDLSFEADGNIVATYSDKENIASPKWVTSPKNLLFYLPKDNSANILLEVTAIAAEAIKNQKDPQDNAMIMSVAKTLISQNAQLVANGLPLNIKKDGDNYILYFDKTFLLPVFNALMTYLQDPDVMQLIMSKLPSEKIAGMFDAKELAQAVFTQLPDVLKGTTDLQMGIRVNKVN